MSAHIPASTAFLMNKGGTAKTTSTLAVAAALASAGGRVLVIDMDQQRNSTILLGPVLVEGEDPYTVLDVTASPDPSAALEACYSTEWNDIEAVRRGGGLVDILPGDDQFSEIHISTHGLYALRNAMPFFGAKYDVVLFDCPPSTGLVVQAALAAAETVIMVSQPEHLSTVGLNQMRLLVDEYNDHDPHHPIRIAGVLVTQFIAQQVEHRAAVAEIRESFAGLMWEPPIPNRAVVQRASAAHYPLIAYPDTAAQQLSSLYAAVAARLLRTLARPELDRILGVLLLNNESVEVLS